MEVVKEKPLENDLNDKHTRVLQQLPPTTDYGIAIGSVCLLAHMNGKLPVYIRSGTYLYTMWIHVDGSIEYMYKSVTQQFTVQTPPP